MNCTIRLKYSLLLVAGIGLLVSMSGCSKETPPMARVSGKVMYGKQPVTSGGLRFAPTSGTVGKPASAVIKSDGSYELTTYASGDGAVVGRHKVLYTAGGASSVVTANLPARNTRSSRPGDTWPGRIGRFSPASGSSGKCTAHPPSNGFS